MTSADRTAQSGDQKAQESWHLDRRVPIALILALFAQAIVMVWQGGRFYAEFEDHDRRIVRLELSDEAQTRTLIAIRETVIRIDERIALLLKKQRQSADTSGDN